MKDGSLRMDKQIGAEKGSGKLRWMKIKANEDGEERGKVKG